MDLLVKCFVREKEFHQWCVKQKLYYYTDYYFDKNHLLMPMKNAQRNLSDKSKYYMTKL